MRHGEDIDHVMPSVHELLEELGNEVLHSSASREGESTQPSNREFAVLASTPNFYGDSDEDLGFRWKRDEGAAFQEHTWAPFDQIEALSSGQSYMNNTKGIRQGVEN